MKLAFDYYKNLEQTELYLCNPDGRELFPLLARNRKLTLRFNDLSELTFDVDATVALSDGTTPESDAYDYIRTKRLVFVTNVGWFQITAVQEEDNGVNQYKSVTCESLQAVFKNKGFLSEERVYCFYNPSDPYDDEYDSTKDDAVPSVVGQLCKQLGIKLDLKQGMIDPSVPYSDWTLTYINSKLIFSGDGSICRTFKSNTTFGYDWMTKDLEDAFEVIVLFDFMYKTIRVVYPGEVTQKANVIYTFANLMKNINVDEKADDIITVLNCSGSNCDITAVNPTGTNYICDFSYYMDKIGHKWMSDALITKIEQWQTACTAKKPEYTSLVKQWRDKYKELTELESELTENSTFLQDLKNAHSNRSILGQGEEGKLCGTVISEVVNVGKKSLDEKSDYYTVPFDGSKEITVYNSVPDFDEKNQMYVFKGVSKTGTVDSIVSSNLSDDETSGVNYWYFSDSTNGKSYCKLLKSSVVDKETATVTYKCKGFNRYIACVYPAKLPTGNSTVPGYVYLDDVQRWINLREQIVDNLNSTKESINAAIETVKVNLEEISGQLNILSYFADTPVLLRELSCYWIEGDYSNENIAVTDNTTLEEEIDLSNDLLTCGYAELHKVSQPRFTFSIDSVNAMNQIEFRDQMEALELGKVVTIEKEEGLWYYPALLEISIDLDGHDFSLAFANATRLNDWGFTYADLISSASATSRKVSASWYDLTSYSKEKDNISSIIKDPLNTTLRAMTANMVNQEFVVDQNGVLGRKKDSSASGGFEKEQIRIINNVLMFTDDGWETAKAAIGKIYRTDAEGKLVTSYGLIAETVIGELILGDELNIKNDNGTVDITGDGITIKRKDNGEIVFRASSTEGLSVKGFATQKDIQNVKKDYSTQFEATNKAISAKADQTTVDEINGTMESVSGQLVVMSQDIEARVTSETFNALGERVGKAESAINQNTTAITAKVSSEYSADAAKSFGWELKDDHFSVQSNGSDIFRITNEGLTIGGDNKWLTVTEDGLKVSGTVEANSGNIAGWRLGSSGRYGGSRYLLGLSSMNNPDSSETCSGMFPIGNDLANTPSSDSVDMRFIKESLWNITTDRTGYSYVRFWTGAKYNRLPSGEESISPANNAKFVILDDGSVYAQAIQVRKALYVFGPTGNSKIDVYAKIAELQNRVYNLEQRIGG